MTVKGPEGLVTFLKNRQTLRSHMKYGIYGVLALFILPLLMPACSGGGSDYKTRAEDPEFIHRGFRRITDIIRQDIFSPPVASRIYAYASVAAYEAMIPGYPEYQTLAGQLNGFEASPKPEEGKAYCYPLSSLTALMKVGKHLIFSESTMEELEDSIGYAFRNMDMPQDVYDRSVAFGNAVADHVIQWSKSDHYAETRSMPKYTIQKEDPAKWVPTPPAYGDAVEPYWKMIRPWVMDSSNQFPPPPHIPYSEDPKSDFFKAAKEVYDTSQSLNAHVKENAVYWDCNPFEITVMGHLMLATKKITPGGHWINITRTACRQTHRPIMETTATYTLVSLALAEGFLSAWTEKYTSELVRPETYINKFIDHEWRPFIETPPFPEHTSAHATISAAAATILTRTFGEPFTFTDSTEVIFELPTRTFNSFYEASDQAAMSRLYGGIHYRAGNEGGRMNGRQVAGYIWDKLKLKK